MLSESYGHSENSRDTENYLESCNKDSFNKSSTVSYSQAFKGVILNQIKACPERSEGTLVGLDSSLCSERFADRHFAQDAIGEIDL